MRVQEGGGCPPAFFPSPKRGVQKGEAPCQGVWGICPQKRRPPTSGTLDQGRSLANEGGEKSEGTPPFPPSG